MMTDASLEVVGKLTSLEELRLGGPGFSDRGLAQLKGLTHLKDLSFFEGARQISDAGLDSVRNMKDLERLVLNGANISDEAMGKLRELKNLKTINIGLPKDQSDRKRKLQELLQGVSVD